MVELCSGQTKPTNPKKEPELRDCSALMPSGTRDLTPSESRALLTCLLHNETLYKGQFENAGIALASARRESENLREEFRTAIGDLVAQIGQQISTLSKLLRFNVDRYWVLISALRRSLGPSNYSPV